MARHVVKRDGATSTTTLAKPDNRIPEKAPIPGGASGDPHVLDPNPASTKIHGLADVAPMRTETQQSQELSQPARRFRVVGGPEYVMYGGCKTRMLHGKIYTENAIDLNFLRRQGVQFEDLDPLPPPTPPAEAQATP
jgi:hypothetical protein